MDFDSVKALVTVAESAKKPPGAVGIHEYISNKLRGGVPFTISRPGCGANAGLRLGRCVDNAFCELVQSRGISKGGRSTKPATMAKYAYDVLVKNQIFPLRTQFAVQYGGSIWTRVDAVGVRRMKNGSCVPVVIELKSTQQTACKHAQTYDDVCRRKRTFTTWGLPNTERNAHRLQGSFGALALNGLPEFRNMVCHAVVVCACTTGARLYVSDPVPPTLFAATPGIRSQGAQIGPAFPRLPGPRNGGLLIRTMLKRQGFKRVASTGANRFSCLAQLGDTPWAFAIIPTFKTKRNPTALLQRIRGMKKPGVRIGIIFRAESGGWAWEPCA